MMFRVEIFLGDVWVHIASLEVGPYESLCRHLAFAYCSENRIITTSIRVCYARKVVALYEIENVYEMMNRPL